MSPLKESSSSLSGHFLFSQFLLELVRCFNFAAIFCLPFLFLSFLFVFLFSSYYKLTIDFVLMLPRNFPKRLEIMSCFILISSAENFFKTIFFKRLFIDCLIPNVSSKIFVKAIMFLCFENVASFLGVFFLLFFYIFSVFLFSILPNYYTLDFRLLVFLYLVL